MLRRLLKNLEEDGHLRELVQGSLTFFVLRVVGIPVSYLFTFLVARLFGAAPVGMFAVGLTVLQMSTIVASLGMDNALLRFVAEHRGRGERSAIKRLYTKSLMVCIPASVLIGTIMYVSADVVAGNFFGKPYIASYIRVASLGVVPAVMFSVNLEALRGLKRIRLYALLQSLLLPALAVVLFLSLYQSGYTEPVVIMVAWVLAITGSFGVSMVMLLKELVDTESGATSLSVWGMLSVALPMFMSSSLFMVMSWTDTIMLSMWRTDAEVGVYNIASRLALFTSFSLVAINSIAAPKFAEFWGRRDMEGLKRIAQQSTRLIFWTSAPVLILYLMFPSFFMGLFGEEFRVGAIVLIIMSIGQFVNVVGGSKGYFLQMTGKQLHNFLVLLTMALINVGLNIFLIPKYGINGAALASLVSIVWGNIFIAIIIYRLYGFVILYFPKPNFMFGKNYKEKIGM